MQEVLQSVSWATFIFYLVLGQLSLLCQFGQLSLGNFHLGKFHLDNFRSAQFLTFVIFTDPLGQLDNSTDPRLKTYALVLLHRILFNRLIKLNSKMVKIDSKIII